MTNKLERLRELVRRAESSEHYWQQQASAMEFAAHGDWLLDRLEKLEAENALYVGATKALHEEREKTRMLEALAEAAKDFLDSDGDYFSWTEDGELRGNRPERTQGRARGVGGEGMKRRWYVGKYRGDLYETCWGFIRSGYWYVGGPENNSYKHTFYGLVWAGKWAFGVGYIQYEEPSGFPDLDLLRSGK